VTSEMKAVIAFVLFVQVVFGTSGGLEGTYFELCTNLTATVVSGADIHTGNAVGTPITFSINSVSGNTMTTSAVGGTLLIGLTNSSNGYVQILDYTSTTLTLGNTCIYPSSSIYCVASSSANNYMFIGSFFNGADIVQLDTVNCAFTNLSHSPVSVKGSQSGPGGQCIAVESQKSIYYIDDASPTLWAYNYSTNTFSNYSMPSDFSDSFFALFGSDLLDFLVYYGSTSGNVYKIPYATMTPAVASTDSIFELHVDDSVDPPNLLDISGFGTKLYDFSGKSLGTGPGLQTASCFGATDSAYDPHTTQYGISQTADAISLSFVANLVWASVLALFFL